MILNNFYIKKKSLNNESKTVIKQEYLSFFFDAKLHIEICKIFSLNLLFFSPDSCEVHETQQPLLQSHGHQLMLRQKTKQKYKTNNPNKIKL